MGGVVQPQVSEPDRVRDCGSFVLQHARSALGGDRVPGQVLRELPVHRAAAVGQHVGELPERVGELVSPAWTAQTAERTAKRTEWSLVAWLRVVVARSAWRAEAEGRTVSHGAPPRLSDSRAG